jgi:hypothetical protein
MVQEKERGIGADTPAVVDSYGGCQVQGSNQLRWAVGSAASDDKR